MSNCWYASRVSSQLPRRVVLGDVKVSLKLSHLQPFMSSGLYMSSGLCKSSGLWRCTNILRKRMFNERQFSERL